jgi:hypothetical protein
MELRPFRHGRDAAWDAPIIPGRLAEFDYLTITDTNLRRHGVRSCQAHDNVPEAQPIAVVDDVDDATLHAPRRQSVDDMTDPEFRLHSWWFRP